MPHFFKVIILMPALQSLLILPMSLAAMARILPNVTVTEREIETQMLSLTNQNVSQVHFRPMGGVLSLVL
jgi:hypothetical protein